MAMNRVILHPSTRIVFFITMAVLLWKSAVATAFVSIVVPFLMWFYGISASKLVKYVFSTLWFVILLVIISGFSGVSWSASALMGYQFILMVVFLSLLSLSSSPFEMVYGITFLLKPLSYLKLPVSEFAFVMSMALRFIPLMSEEVDRIITAQRVRGFNIGNIRHVITAGYSILVPVVLSAFMRAEAMAISMYTRGLDIKKGIPPVKEYKFSLADLFMAIFLIFMVVVLYGA